jgi:acetylornithine/N-succinyldiaminopimelate aminotransferase
MTAGTHGSTFGGNPLAMTVASEVVDIVPRPGFLDQVRSNGERLSRGLKALTADFPDLFEDVRGEGLLLGLKCGRPVRDVAQAAREHGLLTVIAGDDVLRILPPLNVSIQEIEEGVTRLRSTALSLSLPGRTTPALSEE